MIRPLILAALLVLAQPVHADSGADLVFADRTPWADLQGGLVWQMRHVRPDRPAETGSLVLVSVDPPADQPALNVGLQQTDTHGTRLLGRFMGKDVDPIVVHFLTTVTRDLTELTGGSPYYIRNRVKQAIYQSPGVVSDAPDGGKLVEYRPLLDDPNAVQMRGLQNLRMVFHVAADPSQPLIGVRGDLGPEADADDPIWLLSIERTGK